MFQNWLQGGVHTSEIISNNYASYKTFSKLSVKQQNVILHLAKIQKFLHDQVFKKGALDT